MDTGGTSNVRELLNSEGVDTGLEPSTLPEGLAPSQRAPTQDGTQPKLIAGKFKDVPAAEKGYKEAEGKITKLSERQKKLDAILNNPELKKWAATNPEMKKALLEAGYSLAEIEEAQERETEEGKGNTEWNGDTNNVEYRMMLFERKYELREQKAGIESELKRAMKPEEWEETKKVMQTVNPNMDARLAWRMTESFLSLMKDREKKAVEAARGPRRQGDRPPPALLPTGEKSDLQKRPSKMSAQEKSDFIRGIARGDIK